MLSRLFIHSNRRGLTIGLMIKPPLNENVLKKQKTKLKIKSKKGNLKNVC